MSISWTGPSLSRASAGRPERSAVAGERRRQHGSGPARRFTILFVCTGNLCRSPMAERIAIAELRARFGPMAARFPVASAGTHAVVGAPMEPEAAAVLIERGLRAEGFVARELSAELVAESDLILCAAREHRSAVVTINPRALRRTFTLREFHRLAASVSPRDIGRSDPADALASLMRAAIQRRGVDPTARPGDDDIPDPIGRPISAFRACAADISGYLRGPLSLVEAAIQEHS
jgi:protein-tyrosine phosphatase